MTTTLVRSFAGGEVTSALFGRSDLAQYQTGAKLLENFLVRPQGAVDSRAGFEYVAEAAHEVFLLGSQPVRLERFIFAADEAVVMEFSFEKIRFYADGGVLLNSPLTVTGYTQANPAVFTCAAHGLSSGQEVFVQGAGAPPGVAGRQCRVVNATTNTFELSGRAGGASISGTSFPAFSASFTVATPVEVTTPYSHLEVFGLTFTQNSDVLTITDQSSTHPAKELRRLAADNWTLTDVAFGSALTTPSAPTVTPTAPTTGNQEPGTYVVTGTDGFDESLASPPTSANNDLSIAGNYNTISWTSTGADRYNVYKQLGGLFGFIGQTTSTSLIDNNILPDTTITPPEETIQLNDDAQRYPRASCYHEQRRWFAGTRSKPLTVFASKIGLDNSMASSVPARESDAFEVRVFATQQNEIRHLVPLNDLWALTVGGAFRLYSELGRTLSLTTMSVKPRGTSGASTVQPVTTNDAIIYVQALGSRVREISYNRRDTETYTNDNLSIAAGHLFRGRTIVQLAYSSEPEQVVWAVRDDGVLLSLTLVPEQQVRGWARHTTRGGAIESVTVVPEGGVDRVYVAVKRTVNGRVVRYIERMDPRDFTAISDAFFVDSGLRFTGAASTEISGLWHLEGETVSILADGGVFPPAVVEDGAVQLFAPVEGVAAIGLPITAKLETLPLVDMRAVADGQGVVRNVTNVMIRVEQSSQVKAGTDFDNLQAFDDRAVSDLMDAPPALIDGLLEGFVLDNWKDDTTICVQQDLPLPLTVAALILETE